ncbi:MAG: tetratricopeptide repeat protein [Candidatus Eiseniibacteriota bacterium]
MPESIGQYRVLSELGRGGMGVVYEAEQASPRRRVAVKVIRGGQFVDEQRIRMFQREADTLALLEHPNIGAIYESGRTADGHHFFAMELVRGRTLGDWLAARPQPAAAAERRLRLELFRTISDAVHYAHRRGVIHRDLKPGNIVVVASADDSSGTSSGSGSRSPAVKILDFGLARITDGDLALASMTTEVGVIKGTLSYMSPEQARADPTRIDLRSDVYALGVILYEMLTGTRPHDLTAKPLPEAVRILCEEAAPRLGQSSSGRVDADLETIVGKALSKDPDLRYESAAALSEDVHRWLTQQPILARPPTTMYQLRKFAARNRALVGGLAATFVALLAGVFVSTTLGLREAAQRSAAEDARADLQTVVDFQTEMLRGVDPERMGLSLLADMRERVREAAGRAGLTTEETDAAVAALDGVNGTTAALRLIDAEVLDPAAAAVDSRTDLDPMVAAQLHGTLSRTRSGLGLYEGAVEQASRVVELLERERGAEARETLRARTELAWAVGLAGRDAEAEVMLRDVLAAQQRLLPADDPDLLRTTGNLAGVIEGQERAEEAIPLHRQTLEAWRRAGGDDHPEVLESQRNLAYALAAAGQFEEAEPLLLDTIETGRRLHGERDSGTLSAMINLAAAYYDEGRNDDAEKLALEVLEVYRRMHGDDHPKTLVVQNNLAALYLDTGRPEAAEELHRRTLEVRMRTLGPMHPFTLTSLRNLGLVCWDLGKDAEAEDLHQRALAGRRRVLGNDDPRTIESLADLGVWYARRGRSADAEPLLEEQVAANRRLLGEDDALLYFSLADLANVEKRLGKHDEAGALYRAAYDGLRRLDHPSAAVVSYNLACLAAVRGDAEGALRALAAAVDAGLDAADHMEQDEDLRSLRGRPEFAEIVARARGGG